MIRSMTGYGAATLESPALRAAVSVRSLNHRFLELVVHAPRRLQPLEPEVKRLVQSRIHRGRVEVSVQAILADEGAGTEVVVSRPLVAALVRTLRQVQTEHRLGGDVRVGDVVRFPGALEIAEPPALVEASRAEELLSLLGRALDQLDAMRRSEGDYLEGVLAAALSEIEGGAARIESFSDGDKAVRREALLEKVHALCQGVGLDEARTYQEVVRAVERHDVDEEVARLRSHVAQARELLRGPVPCGRPLDFLAQEMAREANTVGSKAVSAPVAKQVVALKGEIERLREQIQNVE